MYVRETGATACALAWQAFDMGNTVVMMMIHTVSVIGQMFHPGPGEVIEVHRSVHPSIVPLFIAGST